MTSHMKIKPEVTGLPLRHWTTAGKSENPQERAELDLIINFLDSYFTYFKHIPKKNTEEEVKQEPSLCEESHELAVKMYSSVTEDKTAGKKEMDDDKMSPPSLVDAESRTGKRKRCVLEEEEECVAKRVKILSGDTVSCST
ncbi:hypothetical protein OTU49_012533 [Cherax quadricarinatus]|uniref:Uncharacterized protein n=1 Tax=Cherax quadricarinatus TaxID=27406 RepID=A0AAW0VWK3_CHEQU